MDLGQSRRRIAAIVVVAACALSWIFLAASLALDWPRTVTVAAVIAAAFSTEAAIWVGAVLLGWTAFANRAQLWRRLTGQAEQA